MKFRRATYKTVVRDLRAFAAWLENASKHADKKFAAENLNNHLDVLRGDDAFGTEGQHDPRGDHRG